MGGVSQETMLSGTPREIKREASNAQASTCLRHHLLAPGCSIDPATPEANLRALVKAAR